MIVFRIENPVTNNGMRYDKNGNYAPRILNLTEGISRDLPMGFNPDHVKDGKKWSSGGRNIAEMNLWFSAKDAYELMQDGYRLYKFEVAEFQLKENEILFTREGIITKEEIEIDSVWSFKQ